MIELCLHFSYPFTGYVNPWEMQQRKKTAILVDGVILNGPVADSKAGEKFVEEATKIIMEEVIKKAADVTEKVEISNATLKKNIISTAVQSALIFLDT